MAIAPVGGQIASELVLQVRPPTRDAGLRLARGTSTLSLGPALIPGETLPAAMRRMTVELLNGAVTELGPNRPGTLDEGIHSARKKLKRVRGLLRLVRDTVGYRTYRDQNVILRDTARTLSGVRDAWVLVRTLNQLREDYAHLLDAATFSQTEAWLKDRHKERQATLRGQTVIDSFTNLGTARSVFDAYPAEERIADAFGSIAGGVRRVYRRGRRGYRRAEETRSIEDLHEWRKRVKYLTYQLEALTPLQPALIGSMASELDELGIALGDDHDLALLAETVIDHPEACVDARERWLLLALIYQARSHLQERSMRRGAALYAEHPQEFVDRVDAYWEAGRR
jgi:CHAD domain-containing protein